MQNNVSVINAIFVFMEGENNDYTKLFLLGVLQGLEYVTF
jgi:hypothetical protein